MLVFGSFLWEDFQMGTALSQDIRDRFAALYAEGHSAREIGRRLMISAATAVRFAAKLRKGKDLIPLKPSSRTIDRTKNRFAKIGKACSTPARPPSSQSQNRMQFLTPASASRSACASERLAPKQDMTGTPAACSRRTDQKPSTMTTVSGKLSASTRCRLNSTRAFSNPLGSF